MGKTKILVFKRNRVCNKCLQTWTMGEKARKEGAACSCASATLPALLHPVLACLGSFCLSQIAFQFTCRHHLPHTWFRVLGHNSLWGNISITPILVRMGEVRNVVLGQWQASSIEFSHLVAAPKALASHLPSMGSVSLPLPPPQIHTIQTS